jgi:hypothetical protein
VDFGFGDRVFVSVMTTFGLSFLWMGWLEKYLPIWIVPLIGLGFALLLIIPWYRKFNRERRIITDEKRHCEKDGIINGKLNPEECMEKIRESNCIKRSKL